MPVTVDIGHILGGCRSDLHVFRQLGIKLPMLDPIDRIASNNHGPALPENAQRGLEIERLNSRGTAGCSRSARSSEPNTKAFGPAW